MGFISYEEALENLKKSFTDTTFTEMVFLDEARTRVLAKDIIAKESSPLFPTSAMDGYAIAYDSQKFTNIKIVGSIPAGKFTQKLISSRECIKTFTGSMISKGCDTLIPIENVTVDGEYITVNESVPKGFAVREVGENYKKGETLIERGTEIDFVEIGILASLNIAQIEVFKRPVVTIISTGSEILDVSQEATNPSQIRSSNHFTLQALAKKAGAVTIRAPLAKDDKSGIKATIQKALEESDIVVTTGGVSVGDYDFIKDIILELNPSYIADGIKIKPGQHIKIVKIGKKYIFALPGFAYSATVTFILFITPLIYKMQGLAKELDIVRAKLKEPYNKKAEKKREFVAVNLSYEDGEYFVDLDGKKSGSSAILTNMLGDIGLMSVGINDNNLNIGDMVDVIRC